MLVVLWKWSATGARYGYNSQEQSTELNLDGNHTTAEFWEYDARSARRWNLDPRPVAAISPYSTFQGNPIKFSDMRWDTTQYQNRTSSFWWLGFGENDRLNYNDGKYYYQNGKEYDKELSEDAKIIKGGLDKLNGDKVGKKLLNKLKI